MIGYRIQAFDPSKKAIVMSVFSEYRALEIVNSFLKKGLSEITVQIGEQTYTAEAFRQSLERMS